MNKNFDLERAAFNIKMLCDLMEDVTANIDAETWEKQSDRLYALLGAIEPLVNDLFEYAANGGSKA